MASVGGLARRATYIRQARRATPDALLVDTGGTLVGGATGPDAQTDELLARALTSIGYDALNVGASEARMGPLAARRFGLEGAPALVASGGLATTGVGLDALTRPYVIREAAGVRIGLVGVASPEAIGEPTGTAAAAAEALRRVLPEVRRQADLIVALVDLEPDSAEALVAKDLDFDVVLGGRSAVDRPAARISRAIFASAGGSGSYVGQLSLAINTQGKIVSFAGESAFLDDGVPDAPDLLALWAEYQSSGR